MLLLLLLLIVILLMLIILLLVMILPKMSLHVLLLRHPGLKIRVRTHTSASTGADPWRIPSSIVVVHHKKKKPNPN
jgi:hypothetical protein